MDKEQIIQMARDSGADCVIPPMPGFDAEYVMTESGIERFAAAIRAATKEEDAKICEDEIASWQRATMSCQDEKIALGMAAKSIRASK